MWGRAWNPVRNELGATVREPSPADVAVAGTTCIAWGSSRLLGGQFAL